MLCIEIALVKTCETQRNWFPIRINRLYRWIWKCSGRWIFVTYPRGEDSLLSRNKGAIRIQCGQDATATHVFQARGALLGRSDSVGSMTTAYHLVLCTHCVPFSSPTIKISPELHEWLIGKQHISKAFSSWPPQWHTQKHIRSKRPHFQGDSTCYTSKFCEWCPETCCLLVGKFGHGFSLLPAGVISFINSSFCPTFCWFPMVSHFSWPFGLVWSYGNVHTVLVHTLAFHPNFVWLWLK